jgi:glycosyltransferase involved in cell wall biosynthesis
MPAVSVVIPVFNRERFIGEAIQSVLTQTLQDFEVIVVDDGSTDDTGKTVCQFSGPISYYRQENLGAGVARNLGVSLAKAEWIAFLDADDLWYPQKLATQMEYVRKCPEADFFYTDMDAIDENRNIIAEGLLKKELERREKKGRASLIFLAFGDRPFPRPSSVLVRKEVFLKVGGFNPRFRKSNHEDFDLFARIAQNGQIYFIPGSLAQYRVHSGQGTNDPTTYDENWLLLMRCLHEMWRGEPAKRAAVSWYLAKHYANQGKIYLRSGAYQMARKSFRMAFSTETFHWRNLPTYLTSLRRWVLSYLPGLRKLYISRKSDDPGLAL